MVALRRRRAGATPLFGVFLARFRIFPLAFSALSRQTASTATVNGPARRAKPANMLDSPENVF
jgi:hypothetical protein